MKILWFYCRRRNTGCVSEGIWKQPDFPRYGYFTQVSFETNPPMVYWVALAPRFHPTTGSLLRYLRTQMEMIRVGVAES
jgi:hypothetical protein